MFPRQSATELVQVTRPPFPRLLLITPWGVWGQRGRPLGGSPTEKSSGRPAPQGLEAGGFSVLGSKLN